MLAFYFRSFLQVPVTSFALDVIDASSGEDNLCSSSREESEHAAAFDFGIIIGELLG
jgi:hypothetical protein